jgi:hypothetical protein
MKKRIAELVALGIIASLALAVGGCAASTDNVEDESMGVWGYVAAPGEAVIELAETQPGATVLLVDRVISPEGAWVVVHLDDNGKPGERVGLAPVPEGESSAVEVSLEGVTTDNVIVALHADRGTAGEFDFEMDAAETSPDRPFFIDGAEVAKVVSVK